jgi:hypothetical protein
MGVYCPLSSLICGAQISCNDVQLLDVQTFPEDVLLFHVLKNPEYQLNCWVLHPVARVSTNAFS